MVGADAMRRVIQITLDADVRNPKDHSLADLVKMAANLGLASGGSGRA